jgi:hypothetical protein
LTGEVKEVKMPRINNAFLAWLAAEMILVAVGWQLRDSLSGALALGAAVLHLLSWLVWRRAGKLNGLAVLFWIGGMIAGLASTYFLYANGAVLAPLFLVALATGFLGGTTFAWLIKK